MSYSRTTVVTRLQSAGRESVVEGLRDAVHVPLDPPPDGVLDLAGVVLDPEALALSRYSFVSGGTKKKQKKEKGPIPFHVKGRNPRHRMLLDFPAKGDSHTRMEKDSLC